MDIDARRDDGRRGIVETTALVALALMIMAVIYLARELLVPLALAILLSFALSPVVRSLRAVGVPKGLGVVGTVLIAFLVIGALGWLITNQISHLIADLPSYQETVRAKIASLRGASAASGALEQVSAFLESVGRELDGPKPPSADRPMDVRVVTGPNGPLQSIATLLEPLVHPFAITGIVVIFVIFILLQREDLRNRFIKLVGTRDLQKTTIALDDAARRLSKLLLMQLAINSCFGLIVGLGLWAIGVPIPVLWGILAAVLRFVPYIGAVISSALPLALAAAVDPGWTMLIWTGVLFAVTEPILGHFIEPTLLGKTTGLSPVAVVVAATFWTWLWGPIGLILATPLTVCLVVLGRHVKGMRFLEVLLGDRPALSSTEVLYQRALASDGAEIVGVAEKVLLERSLSEFYDEVAVGALRLAADDAERGLLSEARAERIRATIAEVVTDLDDYDDVQPTSRTTDPEAAEAVEEMADRLEAPVIATEALAETWRGERAVMCIGAESPLDGAVALLLAHLVDKHGLKSEAAGAGALSASGLFQIDPATTRAVALCALATARPSNLRNAIRRLRRRLRNARIVLVVPGNAAIVPSDNFGADAVANTLTDAITTVVADARAASDHAATEEAAIDKPPQPAATPRGPSSPVAAPRLGASVA
jgi:predicted PurR-regulated permease PerM